MSDFGRNLDFYGDIVWSTALSTQYGFASSWSERHTAHFCGLGTFGVSDGLITSVGKAVRVGPPGNAYTSSSILFLRKRFILSL